MIVASMATYPARADLFWNAARTIVNQVDVLYIVLNEFKTVPDIPNVPPNVRFIIPETDLKDLGKFLPDFGDNDIVFLCDDDIIFPPDYVDCTLASIDKLPASVRSVYGYHGTRYLPARFLGDIESAIGALKHRYYGGKLRKLRSSFFYENALDAPKVVDQLGSGVSVARGRDIAPFAFMDGSRQFVDVRWARWCFENDIACVCLPRESAWLATQSTNGSIYKSFTRRTPKFVRKEIYAFAGRWAPKASMFERP